jgi:hypothetical protein
MTIYTIIVCGLKYRLYLGSFKFSEALLFKVSIVIISVCLKSCLVLTKLCEFVGVLNSGEVIHFLQGFNFIFFYLKSSVFVLIFFFVNIVLFEYF